MMRRRMMASLCGWKNPYVTDGLIAMFDAFANTSTGSHTTNPNKLGLVVGGENRKFLQLSGYTTPIEDLVIVEDDSLLFKNQQGNSYLLLFNVPGVLAALTDGLCTMEACCQPCADGPITSHMTQEWGINFFAGGNNDYSGIRRWMQRSESLSAAFNMDMFCIFSSTKDIDIFNRTKLTRQTHTTIASKTSRYFNGSIYENGKMLSGNPKRFWPGYQAKGDDVGFRMTSSNTRSHDFRIFNFRFYSRQLTPDEIAANYAIDKERFGLP